VNVVVLVNASTSAGGQDAGALGDDGCGGAVGDGVEVGFHPGPDVLPVPYEVVTVLLTPMAAAISSTAHCILATRAE
jgi:hypothetical protein